MEEKAMNINPQYIWIAVSAVGALVVIGLIAASVRRSQSQRLQNHFGAEYDRMVTATGDRAAAERELKNRTEEVKSLEIQPLTAAQRSEYRADWKRIEGHFVDRPTTALIEADELIGDVMRTRGYPMADFERHAAHLSVEHPGVVEHYRAGHAVIDAHARGTASTEDLRQAMLHYGSLFQELVGTGGTDVARTIVASSELPTTPRERLADRIAREEGEARR
jgi:hypothetical protein